MTIAILINTYCRKNGSSPTILRRALDSVFAQSFKDFKVFVIGDRYDPDSEFRSILNCYPQDKMYIENLPVARERDMGYTGQILWVTGGINAGNHGLDIIINQGFSWVAKLDHDDWWDTNHLEEISTAIEKFNCDFVCTKSTHVTGKILPEIDGGEYIPFYPVPCGITHSSVCMNYRQIPLRYVNMWETYGELYPSDANLWERARDHMITHSLKGICINKLTCHHDEEGYSFYNV